jgi:putative ATP-dependent endonuclease of the OLD family
VRVRRIIIENFRGIARGAVDFPGHTLLVGGNNVGKSTVCEALDLVLGTERLFHRPIVDEHDFHNGRYFDGAGNVIVIKIEVVLIDLPEDVRRKLFHKTRPWSEEKQGFVDVDGSTPSDTDAPGVIRALPIIFLGWYDRKTDDFEGKTFFSHPSKESPDEADHPTPGNGLEPFGREWKQACGFIYLRTLRTGRRALSLERGSLLDTILRLGDKGRESMWEDTVKRLRAFDPPVGSIPQLKAIREQVRKRMQRFIGIANEEDATAFFASDLTRANLREVIQFFVRSKGSEYPVPFHRLGTGSINTLVFALLTHIADLRGNDAVIFAMEEPEIALPPHSQRRLTRYLLKKMGQAIVTSHSPHVIDEFEVTQILAIDCDEKHHLSSTAIPTEGIRFRAVRQRKLQLAEAILARGIIVAEGATEVATLIATSRALEAHGPENAYDPFDLTGISVFEAGAHGEIPKWGPVFGSLRKAFFAFHDLPKKDWTAEQTANLGLYSENCQTTYKGIEALLVAEVAVNAQRLFLAAVAEWPDYPQHHRKLAAGAADDAVRKLTYDVLADRKGDGYAAHLIECCQSLAELPKTITEFLQRVNALLKLPPLDGDDDADGEGKPG